MGALATATPPNTPAAPAPRMEVLPPVKRPKGWENLRELVKDHAEDAAFAALNAIERGYELGRHIVEFSERKEVSGEVGRLNRERQDAKQGGRPLAPHCYVAGMLEEDTGLSKSWLEKCARAFIKDRESKFELGKQLSMQVAKGKKALNLSTLGNALPNPERLLPGGEQEEAKPLTPKEEALRTIKPLKHFFYDPSGNPRARKAAEVRTLAEEINEMLEPYGWAVLPKGK